MTLSFSLRLPWSGVGSPSRSPQHSARRLKAFATQLLTAEVPTNPRPAWARVPDRVWQRHSAYLTAEWERQRTVDSGHRPPASGSRAFDR